MVQGILFHYGSYLDKHGTLRPYPLNKRKENPIAEVNRKLIGKEYY